MPLQDLTPQLRTRLNHMERAVGWFIMLATFLLLFGFGYYLYKTAQNKGWFALKARYYTYAINGSGLAVGDKVKLMGFDAGEITAIKAMPPRWYGTNQNVYVEFKVLNENYGYIWSGGSKVRFVDAGFLGKRELDLTKGTSGYGTYLTYTVKEMSPADIKASADLPKLHLGEEIYDGTNLVMRAWLPLATNLDRLIDLGKTNLWTINLSHTNSDLTAMWNATEHHYQPTTKKSLYELPPDEAPSLSDRLAAMVAQVQGALPSVLKLTNQLATVLSNATVLTSNATELTANLNVVARDARTTVTNLNTITANIRDPHGSLGEWLIPTNINQKLDLTLANADVTVTNLNTNLQTLNLTLENFANITSNLNNQVQANTNIITHISDIVVHTDQFIQGLKKFWLFKHLFATKDTQPTPVKDGKTVKPLLSPKAQGE